MGLDMYLHKRTYVKNWSHTPESSRYQINITKGGKEIEKTKIDPDKITYIIQEAGYWRKANAIHQWFVENVQHGEDDCKEYYVSTEQLQTLLNAVNQVLAASELLDGTVANGYTFDADGKQLPVTVAGKVIKDPSTAERLLPTQAGFFFGSTDYDQWYVEDLELTKRIIEDALKDPKGEYEYGSSW
jgi:hypothetical protein